MIKQQSQQPQRNLLFILSSFLLVPFAFLVLTVVVILLAPIAQDQEQY